MKKIAGILASIFMALALVGGSAFLLHEVEKTSIVEEQDEDSLIKANVNGDWDANCNYGSAINGNDTNGSKAVVHIRTAEHLARFAYWVNHNYTNPDPYYQRYDEADVYLDTNIDLSAHYWIPIANTTDYSFKGNFFGNGYTISGMYIDRTANDAASKDENDIGLFGNFQGYIENLNITGSIDLNSTTTSYKTARDYNIGSIAGKATHYASNVGGNIHNCTSSVNIIYHRVGEDGKNYDFLGDINIGGIVGFTQGHYVTSCVYKGYIRFNPESKTNAHSKKKIRFNFGGIAGYSYSVSLQECIFEGNIYIYKPNEVDQLFIGGIVGLAEEYTHTDWYGIYDCISKGTIRLSGHIHDELDEAGVIGGIVGYMYGFAAKIYRCHNYTSIYQEFTGYPDFHVGGILGFGGGKDSFTNDVHDEKIYIKNCSNFAYISNNWSQTSNSSSASKAAGVGGIAGTAGYAVLDISYCVNYGSVYGRSGGFSGGILGNTQRNVVLTNCVNYGYVSSTGPNVGGIAGQAGNKTESNWFHQHPSLVANCISFQSGCFGNIVSAMRGDGTLFSCYDFSGQTWSRANTVSFFNNSSNWTNGTVHQWYFNNPGQAIWTLIKSLLSWDAGNLDTGGTDLYILPMNSVWTYHPNYGSDDDLNNQFYISPVEDQSIIYKKTYSSNTKNAIMPLSATSKTIVKYYVNDTVFGQDDENVGTSQRYINTYVDNDPGFTSSDANFPCYDQIVTLRGVYTSTSTIFKVASSNFFVDATQYSQTGVGSMSITGTTDLSATITSYTRRLGTITITLKPKIAVVKIVESGATGGIIRLNSGSGVSITEFSAVKYVYSGSQSYTIYATPPNGYAVASIKFGTSINKNSKLGSSNDSTRNGATGLFFATKTISAKQACDFDTVTITYTPTRKNVYFHSYSPNGTEENLTESSYGGIQTLGNYATQYQSYVSYYYTSTISLYSKPGYYISSIKAKHTIDNKLHDITSSYYIDRGNSGPVVVSQAEFAQGGGGGSTIVWGSPGALESNTLGTFLQKNFFKSAITNEAWDISNIYIYYSNIEYNTNIIELEEPDIEQSVSAKCKLAHSITCYEDLNCAYEDWESYCVNFSTLTAGTEIIVYYPSFVAYDDQGYQDYYRIECEIYGYTRTLAVLASELVLYNPIYNPDGELIEEGNEYSDQISQKKVIYKKCVLIDDLRYYAYNPDTDEESYAGILPHGGVLTVTSIIFGIRGNFYNKKLDKIVNSVQDIYICEYLYANLVTLVDCDILADDIKNLDPQTQWFDFGYEYTRAKYSKDITEDEKLTRSSTYTFDTNFGYTYAVFSGSTACATSGGYVSLTDKMHHGTLGLNNSLFSTMTLTKSKEKGVQERITIYISDFVGQRVYTSRNTGANAYSSNSQNLYIYLVKEKAEVNIKIADKNKVLSDTSYIDVKNATTENDLDDNSYGHEVGGMTYFTINSEKKIDEYIQTNQEATFSAVAMPGYVFKGIVAVKGSQSPDDNPVQIDALSNAFDIFLKISNLSDGDNIDYSQLENTTIYAYYDIATYKIETYKQIDQNEKEKVSYDASNGYFDWTEGPNDSDRKILSYFDEITFAVKSERYSSDNLEFLGIYLLDGNDEKLLMLDSNYNFVNYNPYIIVTNKVYKSLTSDKTEVDTNDSKSFSSYTRFEIQDVHEKYIHLKRGGDDYYIGANPTSYLRLLVKFATKPTTSFAPTQSNNVIEISSVADLVWLSNQVNNGNDFEGYIIKQTANIDFYGSYIDPIGTGTHPFKGTYDGQGYVIKNLKLTNGNTAIGTNVGLFGYTDEATIKNLTLIGGSVTGFDNVGAVVGCAENTTFENVTNNGCQVTAITYAYYDIYGDKIENFRPFDSSLSVDKYEFTAIMRQYKSRITYKSDRAYGGLVGVAADCTIEGCGARADITDTKLADVDTTTVRGLIGHAFYSVEETTSTSIKECYYIGNLPLHDNDIFDSLVHYIPDSDDPEEQLEVELIENCFYDTNSTRYYIINSDENGTEDQIEPNKFNSAIWFKIGNSYELKIFYWS